MIYTKITSFTDLNTWKEAHKLVLLTYRIVKLYPKTETFILIPQTLRCVISISSNIAEGFSRKGKKEKIQFYYTAKGSLTELQNQLLIAKDLGYLNGKDFQTINSQTITVHKLLNGLIRSLNTKYQILNTNP